MIEPMFRNISKWFVLSFKIVKNDLSRDYSDKF